MLGRPVSPGFVATANVARGWGELKSANDKRVLDAWSRHAGPHVLLNEWGDAEHHVVAVVAAGHAWRLGRVLMVAPDGRGLVRVTPHIAQQGGVLPHRQRHHDRKDNGLKHVILGTSQGKGRASLLAGLPPKNLRSFAGAQSPSTRPAGFRQ